MRQDKLAVKIIDRRSFSRIFTRQASPTEEFFIEKIIPSKKTC
jgi:hypothetical protein